MGRIWHLATCYEGTELRCEDRIVEKYGFDTIVLSGMQTRCPRKTWPAMTIEEYIVLPGYVFIEFTHFNFAWEEFKARTKITGFISDGRDGFYVVPDSDIYELHKRQANGEFSDWRSKAIQYFASRIGSTIQLPNEHRFGGVSVTVEAIVGDNLHWKFTIMNHETKGVIKLCKIWPKEKQAQEYAAVLTLSEGLKLFMKPHPDKLQENLKLPGPPL